MTKTLTRGRVLSSLWNNRHSEWDDAWGYAKKIIADHVQLVRVYNNDA